MILAAGLGTRLRPLTFNRPKALMPVGNKPLIDRLIDYLKQHGINEIIVNAHHHQQQILVHIDGGRPFGIPIEVRVEPEILGTGGGVRNTSDFWDDAPFIVINGDILTDIDPAHALEVHRKNSSLATLVLHDCEPFNQIQIDNHFNIIDIATESHSHRLAFTGIHIIEPELLKHIPAGVKIGIMDCYRQLIKLGKRIRSHISKGHYWRDIGTLESYVIANEEALQGNPFVLGPGCQIHDSATLKDWAIIGENTQLEEAVKIRRSILWENVIVRKGTKVIDSIVTSSREVKSDLIDKVL